jgi:hypothetical protein
MIIYLIIIYHRTQQGNKGDQWLNGQVTVLLSSYYRLHIEAVIGNAKNFYSWILFI